MNKNNYKHLLVIISILTLTNYAFAQQSLTMWDYPIKPGTEEWNNLKTEEGRITAMQIPNDVLHEMTSEEIALSIVNFPLFGYYTAFDTPQTGIDIMFYRFNIFQIICKDNYACNLLVDIYRDAHIEGWDKYKTRLNNDFWTLKFNYLEYLIAQQDVLHNLNDQVKKELIQIAKGKIGDKVNSNSFNSIPGISSSYYLIAHLLNEKGQLKTTDASLNFLKTGIITDFQLIEDIEESIQTILN